MSNPSGRRPYFILNGKSGSCHAEQASQTIERIATQYDAEAQIHILRDGANIRDRVQAALAKGADSVVGGGGDGTLNSVAAALVGSGVPLGILPLGTLNHFAKTLGVRFSLEDAIRDVFEGGIREVDVGDVNGHVFLNNASIGLYPRIVLEREASEKLGRPKWLAMVQ